MSNAHKKFFSIAKFECSNIACSIKKVRLQKNIIISEYDHDNIKLHVKKISSQIPNYLFIYILFKLEQEIISINVIQLLLKQDLQNVQRSIQLFQLYVPFHPSFINKI
jgi:hypothetical protein